MSHKNTLADDIVIVTPYLLGNFATLTIFSEFRQSEANWSMYY